MTTPTLQPTTAPSGVIKVCPDPQCEAVWHNCPVNQTRCQDCNGNIIKINQSTFLKKFANSFFQYDYQTREYFRPLTQMTEIKPNLWPAGKKQWPANKPPHPPVIVPLHHAPLPQKAIQKINNSITQK